MGVLTLTATLAVLSCLPADAAAQSPGQVEYRVLASSKTSTMHKELQEAAEAEFRFVARFRGNP